MYKAMQGLLKAHREGIYDGIVDDLPVFDDSTALDFKNWIQSLEKNADITGYDTLKLCFTKPTGPLTSALHNMTEIGVGHEKRHPRLNFSQTATIAHEGSDILEDGQGANENIQQFVARYKRLFLQATGKNS